MKVISKSIKDTAKIATDLARKIKTKRPGNGAIVIALEGELGVGKTVFAKAFARALGIKSNITSPTFVILKRYPFSLTKNYKLKTENFFYHIDAYRLKDHRDLIAIGIEEILADPNDIVLIEWSDRVQKILPKKHIKIHIDHVNRTTRRIMIR